MILLLKYGFTFQATSDMAFAAGGLEIRPIVPMKKWEIDFNGTMKLNGEDFGDVELRLEWTACSDYFDFDTDMSAVAISKAIATENWSMEFFDRLQASHQTHYEQFGDFTGDSKNSLNKVFR